MSFRNDVSIDWSVSPRIIEVSTAGAYPTEISLQDLYDTVRTLSAANAGIDKPEIIEGSGKESLSETLSVGLTIKLLNAKVKFQNRTSWTICEIMGGNLVAIDTSGASMNPVATANYVNVVKTSSSSATLIEPKASLTIGKFLALK